MVVRGRAGAADAILMLIGIGVLVTLTTALVIRKLLASGGDKVAGLGEVSEQWLAEHRASHPL
jgi:hypothetical protein